MVEQTDSQMVVDPVDARSSGVVSGYGVNKFEGDVVQHLKEKANEYDKQE